MWINYMAYIITLRPKQNDWHFPDNILNVFHLNEMFRFTKSSLHNAKLSESTNLHRAYTEECETV